MLELNIYLFGLLNATSDTALWLLDWGRFLTWWPQIFALLSFGFLLLCKNRYGIGWGLKICVAVLLAVVFNQALTWAVPVVTPAELGVGHHWMRGVMRAEWGGHYPALLFTLSFACFFWHHNSLFTGWIFLLALANAWGVLFVGSFFPLQVLTGLGIGLVASGIVVLALRGFTFYGAYKSQLKQRGNNVGAVTL